jgi:pimeloyl-ACP methyl ester carboxylesterase
MLRSPDQITLAVNGQSIVVWQWPGDLPAIILCHATSFHARTWDQTIARLPGRLCIAIDSRGHGRSSKPAPPYRWRAFAEDLAAVLSQLEIQQAVGVGHSMGGHSAVHTAALRPESFSRLVLLDPTIRSRDIYKGPAPELDFILRRRNEWDSPGQMFERYKDRLPFARWDAAVLRDYCNFGLVPSDTGSGLVLACPPRVEASVYSNNSAIESDLYDDIPAIRIPVHIIRSGGGGEFDGANFLASPTAPGLASCFPNAKDTQLNRISHFIPMEAPDLTAKMIG